ALLAACAVGPTYVRPDTPVPAQFAQAPAAAAQPVPAPDAEFWQAFGDAELTQLVEDALAANHDLRIALAHYDSANALLRGAKFDYLPTITAQGQASDARLSTDQALGARDGRDVKSY